MAKRPELEDFTIAEAIERFHLDTLRPLAQQVDRSAPTRKQDIVPYLTRMLARDDVVRRLYESLSETDQAAVQEALADPEGRMAPVQFQAKYGRLPNLGGWKSSSLLQLFLPREWTLPADLVPILKTFVPEPRPLSLSSGDEIPETVPNPYKPWPSRKGEEPEPIPLRQRHTAPVALREFPTMLRLVESGKIRVSDKTRKPTQATVDSIVPLLVGGDVYASEDESEYSHEPGWDLTIKAFAWPCILQAAGLTSLSGGKLGLSPAGRKALGQPEQEGIRTAWNKWIKTSLFDEFERIEAIKGKKSAKLTAVAERRRAVNDVLAECPAGRWIAVDDFFRFLRASGENFDVVRDVWDLYIAESGYGSLGYNGRHDWELVQGRFILAMLFEYAATLGLIDVAYIPPQGARDDYTDRWGTDDYECLSRYDGLKYFRLNALGAWCLGLTQDYEPEPLVTKKTWTVLPNHDVVSSELKPDSGDVLFLDRVTERTSDRVWRLDREKILSAVEEGLKIDEISEFLESHSAEPIPPTVATLLADLHERTGRLRDKGTARMIECADAETAQLLILDAKLKTLCHLAGERSLVFRESDESAVRSRLRKLGYVVPSRE
jgi:hypothetical protein